MRCPYCEQSISVMSKELNRFGVKKRCPSCGNSIRVTFDIKKLALLFVPLIVLAALAKPYLGGVLSSVLSVAMLMFFSMRLKKAE
jgi:hypothetical protein